jgi:hypothetical protein
LPVIVHCDNYDTDFTLKTIALNRNDFLETYSYLISHVLYTKDESSQLRQTFWTTFGQYIAPQLSAEGLKINWINYKTGLKYVYFKMAADKHLATIAIELSHPDDGIQELFYEQFIAFKNILKGHLNEEWVWELHGEDENGKITS